MTEQLVEISQSDLERVREMAAAEGVDIEDVSYRALDPFTATLIVSGSAFAVGTILHLIDRLKGGQVIDLRPGAPATFARRRDLLYGLVAIISQDGTVVVEVKEPRGMLGLVLDLLRDKLPDFSALGADAIADRARTALGDRATVRVEPGDS